MIKAMIAGNTDNFYLSPEVRGVISSVADELTDKKKGIIISRSSVAEFIFRTSFGLDISSIRYNQLLKQRLGRFRRSR